MTRKLLNSTARAYFKYALLLLVLVAPLFYIVNKALYEQAADESLMQEQLKIRSTEFFPRTLEEVDLWNTYNGSAQIVKEAHKIKQHIFTRTVFIPDEHEYEPYRFLQTPISIESQPFVLETRISLVETEDILFSLFLLFLAFTILLLGGFYWLTVRLSRKIWEPFNQTLKHMHSFNLEDENEFTFASTNIEEFQILQHSFLELTKKTSALFNQQKEFIEHAAHELQTPIAVFQTKIDSLLQIPNLGEQVGYELLSIQDTLSRLKHLNKNLLLLSSIQLNNSTEINSFSVAAYLEQNIPFYQELAQSSGSRIDVSYQKDSIIATDSFSFDLAVRNLLVNAIIHSPNNSQIQLSYNHKTLIVQNPASEGRLDITKIFNRFYKKDPSSTGSGLGLAIVNKIAAVNDWKILYEFTENKHSFTVLFHPSS
jgi:two-component system sensor histidine kinase ArlS